MSRASDIIKKTGIEEASDSKKIVDLLTKYIKDLNDIYIKWNNYANSFQGKDKDKVKKVEVQFNDAMSKLIDVKNNMKKVK